MGRKTKLCRECGTANPLDATTCSNCGATFNADEKSDVGGSGKSGAQKAGIGCLVLFGLIFVIGLFSSPDENVASESSVDTEIPAMDELEVSGPVADPSMPDENSADVLTGPQRNAARSAQSYLDMTGFSRLGLIEQLSSDAGEGYNEADAIAAVDSLNVDWNEQAVRSARQYLDMMGFSCSGLIEQLSSSAGERYTTSEARYGAEQAGAC